MLSVLSHSSAIPLAVLFYKKLVSQSELYSERARNTYQGLTAAFRCPAARARLLSFQGQLHSYCAKAVLSQRSTKKGAEFIRIQVSPRRLIDFFFQVLQLYSNSRICFTFNTITCRTSFLSTPNVQESQFQKNLSHQLCLCDLRASVTSISSTPRVMTPYTPLHRCFFHIFHLMISPLFLQAYL
jgi:hypothetical protein